MENIYNWEIASLECHARKDNKRNIVYIIHWRANATDDVYVATIYGSQEVEYKADQPFTEFKDLTENQVKQWLFSELGDKKEAVELMLDEKIKEQKEPLVVKPKLPWL